MGVLRWEHHRTKKKHRWIFHGRGQDFWRKWIYPLFDWTSGVTTSSQKLDLLFIFLRGCYLYMTIHLGTWLRPLGRDHRFELGCFFFFFFSSPKGRTKHVLHIFLEVFQILSILWWFPDSSILVDFSTLNHRFWLIPWQWKPPYGEDRLWTENPSLNQPGLTWMTGCEHCWQLLDNWWSAIDG